MQAKQEGAIVSKIAQNRDQEPSLERVGPLF
jgi:hypothetical protein